MPAANPDDSLVLIRCPSCGQRFKVGEDLKGRTVECGGCEHRFRINEEVIVRGRKFYPGERRDPRLNRFHRVPLAMDTPSAAVPTVNYAPPPDPVSLEPTPPLRILAAAVGVCLMLFMALLFILGSERGGMLDEMPLANRLIMAGFTGLLGLVLVVFGNPKAPVKAGFFAFLIAAGLCSLPLVFTPPDSIAQADDPGPAETGRAADDEPPEPDPDAEIRALIGTGPLEDEIARLEAAGSTRRAIGLWLRGLRESNRLLVRDFVLRTLDASDETHYFPRGDGDFLMVVTGIAASLDDASTIVSALGEVVSIYPSIAVIEVRVNNESFVEGPIEKLTNREDPAFYDLNKRELESIDIDRVAQAVRRLADAEPKVYRSDITRRLLTLLAADWVDFKGDVCRALAVWSEQPGPAGDVALGQLRAILSQGKPVPVELVSLIVREGNAGVIPFLDELWAKNPVQWESLYIEAGPQAEPVLVRRFPGTDGPLRRSAVNILGRIGGRDSLELIESASSGGDPELQVMIERAAASIRSRINP